MLCGHQCIVMSFGYWNSILDWYIEWNQPTKGCTIAKQFMGIFNLCMLVFKLVYKQVAKILVVVYIAQESNTTLHICQWTSRPCLFLEPQVLQKFIIFIAIFSLQLEFMKLQ